jgi:hypothetical protein
MLFKKSCQFVNFPYLCTIINLKLADMKTERIKLVT